MKHSPLSLRFSFAWSVVVVLFASMIQAAAAQETTTCPWQTFYQNDDNTVTIRHMLDVASSSITIQVEYEGQAWLGFAFASDPEDMVPNVAVIGLPDEKMVQKYDLAGQNPSLVTPVTESTPSFTDGTIMQNETHTILQFTQSLQASTNANEVSVKLDASNTFIWAVGTSNTLSFHLARGGSQFTLSSQCNNNDAAPPSTEASLAPSPAPAAEEGGPLLFEDGEIEIAFESDSEQGTLTVEMTYAGQGYVAFAFSNDRFMPDSTAVIALPDDGTGTPFKYSMTGRTESAVQKLPQDQQTLIDASYMQNDTHTYMKFTKKIQEDGEPTVSLTQNNFFLYAVGNSNELEQHGMRSAFEANPSALGSDGVTQAKDFTNLWKAHGACMAVAWAILVPLGIGSSVVRNLSPFLQNGGMWFQIHRTLNSIGVALTIAGFGIAVHVYKQEKGSSVKHFSDERHHTMGLVIFIFALLQALNGIFRPHLPHAATASSKPDPSAPVEDPAVRFPEPGNEGSATGVGEEEDDENDARKSSQPASSTPTTAAAATPSAGEKSKIRIAWEYFHKVFGVVTVVLAWFNCNSGIDLYDDRYDDFFLSESALWGIIFGITCVVLVLGVYLRFFKK
jgi:hypothetical protein